MRTIFKQKLDVTDHQIIEIPVSYKILHLGMQEGNVCMWYECTPDAPLKKVEIRCFGTGYNMPDYGTPDGAMEHIGTVLTEGGMYVWHYYMMLRLL